MHPAAHRNSSTKRSTDYIGIKGEILWKNPFFLFLGAYIRVSEVTSKCNTRLSDVEFRGEPDCIRVCGWTDLRCQNTTVDGEDCTRWNWKTSCRCRRWSFSVQEWSLRWVIILTPSILQMLLQVLKVKYDRKIPSSCSWEHILRPASQTRGPQDDILWSPTWHRSLVLVRPVCFSHMHLLAKSLRESSPRALEVSEK